MTDDWDERVEQVWADVTFSDGDRIALIDTLASELDPADMRGPFERAGARDSAGLEDAAEPLYREALAGELDADRRSRAVIQYASTLRNLGRIDECLALLREEYETAPDSPLHDAAAAFYALALASHGDAVAATSIALKALAPHLPRYTRSVTAYADELRADTA